MLYIPQLKKEVEKLSGKNLAPFLCIEYRIATELSGLVTSYLAKVGPVAIETHAVVDVHG